MENAFGILANRFGVFLSPISLSPESTEKVTLASCVLHNYLRTKSMNRYMPIGAMDKDNEDGTVRPGDWRSGNILPSLNQQGANAYTLGANEVRNDFCSYFNNEGCVPWQNNCI